MMTVTFVGIAVTMPNCKHCDRYYVNNYACSRHEDEECEKR